MIRLPTHLRSARPITLDSVRFRRIHGYRRAFIQAGSGPAILLIHGIGDSADSWLGVIPELAKTHTVIAPDLLGHGDSAKPRADYSLAAYANAMRDLLSVLDIDRVTVVGHSLGGGVAMQFAYQFPRWCERLVLISTGGVSHEVQPLLRLAAAPNADFVLPLFSAPGSRAVGRMIFGLLRALDTDLGRDAEPLFRVFESLPDPPARRAFIRTLRAVVDWRGQAITMLDRCYLTRGMPTMLLWGARDGVIPVAHANKAHMAMPGSRLEVFEDAGHFPHQDDPRRFLAVFRDFYQSTQPSDYDEQAWRKLLREGSDQEPAAPTPRLRRVTRPV